MAGYLHRGLRSIIGKSPQDIVILTSVRTPLTRAKKGGLKDAYPEELLFHVLRATLAANLSLDPSLMKDVAVGSVLQELGGAKAGKMAANHASLPSTTAFHTINRQCSSGLAAITTIAHAIASYPDSALAGAKNSPVKDARDCIMPMGLTSEHVASRYDVSRADQDAFAARSHQKAAKARTDGLFGKEIVPVKTRWRDLDDPENLPEKEITVTADDGIRPTTTVESLAKLKPAFKADGTSTAGNSSQITDGAAATLLMRRSTAVDLGLSRSVIGKWAGSQVVGCHPDEMGVGPALAIPKLLSKTGIKQDEVQIWEINEAFASQALYCRRKLGIDEERVNMKGGAIGLGHPLGATGARQVATMLPEMERRGLEVGVVSACVGTGMGFASLFIRE